MAKEGETAIPMQAAAVALAQGDRERHNAIIHIQWALALACAYLLLFNEQATWSVEGGAIVACLLTVSLVLGRLRPSRTRASRFGVVLGLVDAVLIIASLFVAGQLTMPMVMLCLGVLILAIAGLRVAVIALLTLAMTGIYLLIVWKTGEESFLRSSVLLRVPILFAAAITFAWLVETGSPSAAVELTTPRDELQAMLERQQQAIDRCAAALRAGTGEGAAPALDEIAALHREIRTCVDSLED